MTVSYKNSKIRRNDWKNSLYYGPSYCGLYIVVLGWLEEKLPQEKNLPSSLVTIVPPLYSCLEDRSGDVRKKAQAVVPCMMAHLGFDTMNKQANKLKVGNVLVYALGDPIDPLQFMGMQLQLEDKTIDSSSQEDKNLLFCPPDEAVLTSHARGLLGMYIKTKQRQLYLVDGY
ncbi:Cytoskeleton-associated protein 5 [Exaiptasia diaphana]|nr:Cytoskeleton-associated protein 5 [Exaiptasia diaphana]